MNGAAGATIALIAAVAENGVIGAGNHLPWRVRADFRRFRFLTMGRPIIMGRKTFESIGRVLDGRESIVVTRRPSASFESAVAAASLEVALAVAREKAGDAGEIFVIGGGQLFNEAMPLAKRLYVTHIGTAPEGDTYFPEIPAADWVEVSRETLPASDGDTASAVHVVYERRTWKQALSGDSPRNP